MSSQEQTPEPLPIWFFVGLILLVYGVLIAISGLLNPTTHTVLSHLRPALWWGAIMAVVGAAFLGLGLHTRTKNLPDKQDRS